jgi:hypothetical protein
MLSELEFRHKRKVLVDWALDSIENPGDPRYSMDDREVLEEFAAKVEALVLLRGHTERG